MYFELKTLSGTEFCGWLGFKEVGTQFLTIARTDHSIVIVPLTQVVSLEQLPEGHRRIPEWAGDPFAQKAEVQV